MNNEHPSPSNIFERLRGAGINRQDSQWLGGVAAGIATRLNVDVVLVRGVFVALSLLAGFGLIIYAIAWALLADTSGKIHLEQAIVNKEWAAALTGASIFLGVGIFVAPWLLSTVAPVLWPVLVIAGIAFVIFSRRNSKFAGSKAPHSEDHKTKTPATDTTSAPHPRTGSVIEVPWRDPGESSLASARPCRLPQIRRPLPSPPHVSSNRSLRRSQWNPILTAPAKSHATRRHIRSHPSVSRQRSYATLLRSPDGSQR